MNVVEIGLEACFRGNDGEVVGGRYGVFRASDFLQLVGRRRVRQAGRFSGQGGTIPFGFADDLAEGFPGKFNLESCTVGKPSFWML